MKKEFKEKLMRGFACGSRRNIMGQHASVSGFWIVRHGVNHPLMFRLLLVRYIIVFFLLLALCITIAFYVGRERHLHISPQADISEYGSV